MSTQTPNDYKEYFLNRFISLFQLFTNDCIEKVRSQEIKDELQKIANLYSKLNYGKIISKLCSNTKLQEGIAFIVKNNFDDAIMQKVFSLDTKVWALMPSFHINKIFSSVDLSERVNLYNNFHALHVCAFTYNKVLESMQSNNEEIFNPYGSVGKVAENMDIDTMFGGVEVKTYSAFEMLMEQLVNQQMEGKMQNYMENIKETDVNQAADKLTDVLNSENFKGNKQTTKILGDMLSKIKDEVINLGNDPDGKATGKKGVEQLLGIAQKVAGGMMSSIKSNNVNVLELWDATSSLAKSATNSDALNIVDKLIRSNIEKNMQAQAQQVQQVQQVQQENQNQDQNQNKKNKNKNKKLV